jgi:Xaa-Pro aminopeptidase
MFKLTELSHRRRQLLSSIEPDALIILIAAPEYARNGDVLYPYRQESDFYYLTAFPEPEAIALLVPDKKEGKFILFNRADKPAETTWRGPVIGQDRACQEYGANEAYSIDQLEMKLPDYLAGRRVCYYVGDSKFKRKPLARINTVLSQLNKPAVKRARHLINTVHEMRLKKSNTELDCLRLAATISSKAHIRAMQACRPDNYEYQLEAELLYEFYQQGSCATAYPNIVASGANACILHYINNRARLRAGDLVLVDAGCEYQYYASDITRTFPVNGRFSQAQKTIYNMVLKTQQKLIDLIKPDVAWDTLQKSCVRSLTEGLIDIGLLKGRLADLIRAKAYKKFYMHGCSHWLGLDVHDVGSYKLAKKWRPLEEAMVFTVEPGIYIRPSADVDEKWWNIGIRIEDDVCVTTEGCEVMTQRAPKDIADIESLMRSSS